MLGLAASPPHLRPLDSLSSFPQKKPFHASSSSSPFFAHGIIVTPSLHSMKQPSLLSKSASVPMEDGLDEAEFEIEVNKVGNTNRRIIQSRVRVDADLETVWSVLTDYEGLADFIPSLAVSQLLDKKDKFARLYQVGEQNLALGLKFNAKGVLDCYERDLEHFPSGRRRDIEFKMVEGDFQTFEGRWSIQQIDNEMYKDGELSIGQEFQTTLLYIVELEPKLWLPVRLLEGRVCREVKNNLLCVREEAQRVQRAGRSETFATTWDTEENNASLTG